MPLFSLLSIEPTLVPNLIVAGCGQRDNEPTVTPTETRITVPRLLLPPLPRAEQYGSSRDYGSGSTSCAEKHFCNRARKNTYGSNLVLWRRLGDGCGLWHPPRIGGELIGFGRSPHPVINMHWANIVSTRLRALPLRPRRRRACHRLASHP
jgi:hypothetical protein